MDFVTKDGSSNGKDKSSKDTESSGDSIDDGHASSVVGVVEERWDEEEREPNGVSEKHPRLGLHAHLFEGDSGEELIETNHKSSDPVWDLAAAESVVSEAHFQNI